MTNTSKTKPNSGIKTPIVFFGTEDFSLGTLQALVENSYNIAAIVTKPDAPKGRGQKLTPPTVKVFGEQHNIPVWQPTKLSDIADDIKALGSPAGVLVSYGKIIPQAIIDLFTPGIINIHPSLLPKYRGPSPIESAILNGDTTTGVSIMQLSAAMDAGPVYHQESYELQSTETAPELYNTLGGIGVRELLKVLPSILDSTLQPTQQDDSSATYCSLIKKSDGIIDWDKPAEQIEREIRTYRSWPQSRTVLGSVDIIITKAYATSGDFGQPGDIKTDDNLDSSSLAVQTADGHICIDALKPIGKKEMPVQAFLAGYKERLRS